jgi:hypothetical protein
MEHRWGKRIAVELPVTVVHVTAKRVGQGCLRDISLGGGDASRDAIDVVRTESSRQLPALGAGAVS